MSLTCQVQVVLDDISREKADTVRRSLEPDNVNFPDGLSLNVEDADGKLIFNFGSKGNVKQLVGTIDEVLEHIHVALKVIE